MTLEKNQKPSPQISDAQFISEQQVEQLIDVGERLSPTSDSEKKRLPKLSEEDVDRMVRIVDSIVEDPKFERRIVDEMEEDSVPNQSVQTRPTSRPV